jgi:hypothetical protein
MDNLTHMVVHPEHLYVREGDDGEVAVLNLEDNARVKTMVFFEAHLPKQT